MPGLEPLGRGVTLETLSPGLSPVPGPTAPRGLPRSRLSPAQVRAPREDGNPGRGWSWTGSDRRSRFPGFGV